MQIESFVLLWDIILTGDLYVDAGESTLYAVKIMINQ